MSVTSGPKITIPVACAGESRAHLSWGQGGECHGSASRILNALCSRSGLTVSLRGAVGVGGAWMAQLSGLGDRH